MLGASQSTEGFETAQGYHVLQVVPNSPASKAGLTVYFDYITHVNGMSKIQQFCQARYEAISESP
eukprot:jgi/Hompol1/4611/HPOL_000576-RA